MASQKSFERAVLEGDISGPEWPVIGESGEVIEPGDQDYGHTQQGRIVRSVPAYSVIGHVIDYQVSATVSGKTAFLPRVD
jgi:hypothetical protein